MGAALIAVGVFISSLTDNQGLAAGIGIAVILLNYYSVSLSEYVSSTAGGGAGRPAGAHPGGWVPWCAT